MVGYKRNDTLTPSQKLMIGCVSGMVTRFVTQPLDVIKIRTQIHKKKKTLLRTTRKIAANEGFRAFFHGHTLGQIFFLCSRENPLWTIRWNRMSSVGLPPIGIFCYTWCLALIYQCLLVADRCYYEMHSVVAVSTQFFAFEMATEFMANSTMRKTYRSFICGLFGGCCSAFVVIPLEVIRVRQMVANEQYSGLIKGAKNVYKTGGFLAFYEGLGASLLQMGPASAISFGVFSYLQPWALSRLFIKCGEECHKGNTYRPQDLLVATFGAASVAGLTSKTLTYPFDLAKRRLQFASHQGQFSTGERRLLKCNKLWDCLIIAYKKEGLRGLYRGLKVTLYKAQLTSIVVFTSYEMLCFLVREFNDSASP